jgi:hypothetical protein
MDDPSAAPILDHPLGEASVFTAEALIEDVRRLREIGTEGLPRICFLEFDGDLTDWLVDQGIAVPVRSWACFHTTMFSLMLDGVNCGIIGRTIGGLPSRRRFRLAFSLAMFLSGTVAIATDQEGVLLAHFVRRVPSKLY